MKTLFDKELSEKLSDDCKCTCCEDARKRIRCDRQELIDSCWCYMSPPKERCTCDFCVQALKIRNAPENIGLK